MAPNAKTKKQMSAAELSIFFSNLELFFSSGLPLVEGFDIMKNSATSADDKSKYSYFFDAASKGMSLHDALKSYGGFPEYALSLINIGEKTGNTEETLGSLSRYYEKRDELMESLRAALVYPATMLIMVFVVVAVLLTQVMPVFNQVYSQLGFQLNDFAAMLLNIGNTLNQYALIIGGVIVVIILAVIILRFTGAGKQFFKGLFEGFPLTRQISRGLSEQHFALALNTMLKAGLDYDESIDLVLPIIEDKWVRSKTLNVKERMNGGQSFQESIEGAQIFPHGLEILLTLGFKTGNVADVFSQIGDYIVVSTERKMNNVIAAVEPILVAIMCVLVGVTLLSVMLPLVGVLTSM